MPGSPSGLAAVAADHRTYSNPAFQGGWVGRERMGCFLLYPVRLPLPPAARFVRGWILISGGPSAQDCARLGVKLNYCIWGSCASSNSYSLFLIRSSRELVSPCSVEWGCSSYPWQYAFAVCCVNSYSLVQFDLT